MNSDNQLTKVNDNGDLETIIQELPEKTIKKTKYGVIRLMGEKQERRVSYQTYHKLKTLPSDFTGKVSLNELNIVTPVNQIVFMEEREEDTTEWKNFTNLPTDTITLDTDFNIITGTRAEIERKYDEYISATCHYQVVNNNGKEEKAYDLEFQQIPCLVYLHRSKEKDYPHEVYKIIKYGMEQQL